VGESRSLFTFAARPAPCRLPRSGAGLVKGRAGRFRLSPRLPRALWARRTCTEKDASLRLLQPTYDHVHPARTIRFPCVPALCHPSRSFENRHRPAFGRWTSGRSTGGASLDGDPPASAIAHDTFSVCVRSLDPERSRRRGRRAILAELRSKAPPRNTSRPRRFRPRTELVTWPLTLSVATRRHCLGLSLRRGPKTASTVPPGPPRPAASSKATELVGPERLPSTMNPSASPRFTGAVARASPGPRITRIPALPHGIAAVRTRGLAAACTRRLSTGPATLPLPVTWREQATTPLHPFARSKSPSARGRTAPEGCPPVREA